MFGIMLQKMWHKKWMNLSLLIGCVLLIATAVSFPLYQQAAYDRMLQDEFNKIITNEGRWPTINSFATQAVKSKNGTIEKLEGLQDTICNSMGVTEKLSISFYSLTRAELSSDMKREDAEAIHVRIGGMTGLEEHIDLVSGEGFSETGIDSEGRLEVIIPESCLVQQGFLVGETLTFSSLKGEDGEPIRIVIKGVFRQDNEDEFYWQVKPLELFDLCFIRMDLFKQIFTGDNAAKYSINCKYFSLFEYKDIGYDDVATIVAKTHYYTEKSKFRSVIDYPKYMSTLDSYLRSINRISATLIILQIPVLIMLCAFLLMISGQMYEMERNEISVIKSRGSSRGQIFRLYLYQSILLTIGGAVGGIPLGMIFSRILGATRNFLEFDLSEQLSISFTPLAVYYALGAMLLTLASMTIPAIRHSKVSIVNLKQQKALKKKPLWQKLFIDFVLLGVSIYGYYSFHKNMKNLSETVLQGESMDPLLYVSSSAFILGLGLLFLRLQPYLVQLIYLIGRRFWKSASYISFMENVRNGRKQQLIMLFLIMTISLGIYHATVARTILDNAVQNTEYLTGTDVVLKEVWPKAQVTDGSDSGGYIEPDFSKYLTLEFADSLTKVMYDEGGYISVAGNDKVPCTIMGIHTKEFGQMTSLDRSLLDKQYYALLNELSAKPDGVIASRGFETVYGYKIGDSISFYDKGHECKCTIVDFVDFFPSYAPETRTVQPDGTATTVEQLLLITHFDLLYKKWGTAVPYEIWISLAEGYDEEDVYAWIEDKDITLRKYVNKQNELQDTMEDPLLQGTNGVLTMGFVVTILLCAIGYLIYWVMAIRERELMFGVLRACGFHKSELVHMLINEQIFSGVLSVFAGIGIGQLTSRMFVPILQQAYASQNQVLPMHLITDKTDMLRLYAVVAGAMVVALVVLIILLFRMNVTKALKIGEE